MDLQADFAGEFSQADEVFIDGYSLRAFVCRPGVVEEPYYGAPEAPGETFLLTEKDRLAALGQWPLLDPEIEIEGQVFRPLRVHESLGHVQIFVQEAN